MQKRDNLRLIRRLLVLAVLIGCLGFLTSGHPAAASPWCSWQYNECNVDCTYRYPSGSQALMDCTGACFSEYQECVANGN